MVWYELFPTDKHGCWKWARNYGGGAKPTGKIFWPFGKICRTKSKKYGPLSKNSIPPLVSQDGYEPGQMGGRNWKISEKRLFS